MLVIGDRDMDAGAVSVRLHSKGAARSEGPEGRAVAFLQIPLIRCG